MLHDSNPSPPFFERLQRVAGSISLRTPGCPLSGVPRARRGKFSIPLYFERNQRIYRAHKRDRLGKRKKKGKKKDRTRNGEKVKDPNLYFWRPLLTSCLDGPCLKYKQKLCLVKENFHK